MVFWPWIPVNWPRLRLWYGPWGGFRLYEPVMFYWCFQNLVWYLHCTKRHFLHFKADAKSVRGGPKVNFPLRTLNNFESFLLGFLRYWSRILFFFYLETLIIGVCWQIFRKFDKKINFWFKIKSLNFPKNGEKLKVSKK